MAWRAHLTAEQEESLIEYFISQRNKAEEAEEAVEEGEGK